MSLNGFTSRFSESAPHFFKGNLQRSGVTGLIIIPGPITASPTCKFQCLISLPNINAEGRNPLGEDLGGMGGGVGDGLCEMSCLSILQVGKNIKPN